MDWLNGFLADTETLLQVGFVQSAIIAAALLGLVSGVITPLVLPPPAISPGSGVLSSLILPMISVKALARSSAAVTA